MGRIPTVTSQISSRSGTTNAGVQSRRATGDDFGAYGARGVQAFGAGLATAGAGINSVERQQQKELVANKVAQSDFTREELETRNEVGPDAAGYQELTLDKYDAWVDEQAESIEDDEARQAFKERMNAQRPSVSSRSAQYEFGTAAQNSRDEADASLVTLDNKIRSAPDGYDEFVSQGFEVIDARSNIPATKKAQMKRTWSQNAALSRFEGLLEGARGLEDVEALQSELEGNEDTDWRAELSSAGYERISSLADAASRSIQTQADADARGAVEFLEGRASDVTSIIPRAELRAVQQVVSASSNPVTQQRLARIVRDQEIVAQTRKLTAAQQRDVMQNRQGSPSLPPRLNSAITTASNQFGVSTAYLAATAQREYGSFLTGDPEAIDYGQGNIGGNSSAMGVPQFLDGTWESEVMNREAFTSAMGIDTSSMSKQDILDLRKDPEIAIAGLAFWTAENTRIARGALGREPTDADLYIMHFMGRGGGPRLFRMVKANPNVKASDMFPEAAKANKSVYYNKDGTARSVREVYNELGRMHGGEAGSETYVEYGDRETRDKVLSDTEKRVSDDVMGLAESVGNVALGDVFGEGGMRERGEHARKVADYYSIPMADMKPFKKDEAASMRQQLQDGSADEVLSLLTSIQQMGGETARAGMAQIGADGDVYAYAGSLQLETGQGSVAADIVKGQKRMEENPDIKTSAGLTPTEFNTAFLEATGGALLDASPKQRQAIADAAMAHYVETQVARGRSGSFSAEAYEASVQAVLGGRQGAPAIGTVNGSKTVMPPGVTGEALEEAFDSMTVADWSSMSPGGSPPRYVTGVVADPEDLADEAQLRGIGGGQYRVVTSDGGYLVTGRLALNGQLEPFIFEPTSDKVQEIRGRDAVRARGISEGEDVGIEADVSAARESEGKLTHLEMRALVKKYGAEAVEALSADQ